MNNNQIKSVIAALVTLFITKMVIGMIGINNIPFPIIVGIIIVSFSVGIFFHLKSKNNKSET